MRRRDFLSRGMALGICPGILLSMLGNSAQGATGTTPAAASADDMDFVRNWLADLIEGITSELAPATQRRIMAAPGRGCFRRSDWRSAIAENAGGRIDNLLSELGHHFRAWREGNYVHVRYNGDATECRCPMAAYIKPVDNDPLCDCCRGMQEALFEGALHRPIKVTVVSSLRRNGPTCHFMAEVGM